MCGVCGYHAYAAHARHDAAVQGAMLAALTHRGPDAEGAWTGGPRDACWLGHRRLRVIDLEGGVQPMVSADGRYALVFNGEVYNYRELRAEREARGAHFRTNSDTEVLLDLFAERGPAALDRLNGMFAFAIYDRERNTLFAARDRLGIKPLYYADRGGCVAFASELGALRAGGWTGDALNPAALDAYFQHMCVPAPDTIYAAARKLGPGEYLEAGPGGVRTTRYWQPRIDVDQTMRAGAALEAFETHLEAAVRARTVADVPLGAFLSGGVDSSTVVAALQRVSNAPVKTFTIGFDDAQMDELAYARAVAGHLGTDHTETLLRPELTDLLPRLVRHFGEPFADSSALPMWLVSQVARESVTVALSGDGGDELFAGYTWLHRTRDVMRYRRVPAPLRAAVGGVLAAAPDRPAWNKLRRFHADAQRDDFAAFRRRQTTVDDAVRAGWYQPDWAAQRSKAAPDRYRMRWDEGDGLPPLERMRHQDLRYYLPEDILTKVDRMSMAHGLEARVPLLDHRLVDWANTVPMHLKLRGRHSKWLMKQALRGRVPGCILAQRKQGFAIPLQRWLRGPLRAHAGEVLLAQGAAVHAYVRPEAIRALWDAHQAGREHHGHALWALLVLGHWLAGCRGA